MCGCYYSLCCGHERYAKKIVHANSAKVMSYWSMGKYFMLRCLMDGGSKRMFRSTMSFMAFNHNMSTCTCTCIYRMFGIFVFSLDIATGVIQSSYMYLRNIPTNSHSISETCGIISDL